MENFVETDNTETYSFQDVLKNVNKEIVLFSKVEQKLELKQCSYNQGYKSQELFACLTCFKEKAALACICVGCSLNCHKDHEIINLYFKRNYKCDCGNYKFVIPCALQNEKDFDNNLNIYNHNFTGKYCYCDGSEEEDNEDNEEETNNNNMIQCIICEDWYHHKHLEIIENCDDEEGDLICRKCLTDKLLFLNDYPYNDFLSVKEKDANAKNTSTPSKENKEVNLINSELKESSNKKRKFYEAFPNSNDKHILKRSNSSNKDSTEECQIKLFQENNNDIKSQVNLNKDIFINFKKLMSILCFCSKCKEIYTTNGIEFISDPNFYDDWSKRELIEEVLNKEAEEETLDNQNLISDINNVNIFNTSTVKNLTMEKQIELSMTMKSFSEKFIEFIKNAPIENNTITGDHIKKFLQQYNSENPFTKDLSDTEN